MCVEWGIVIQGPWVGWDPFFFKESYELVDSIDGRGYDTYHYEESGVWFRLAVGDRYLQTRTRSFEEGHCCQASQGSLGNVGLACVMHFGGVGGEMGMGFGVLGVGVVNLF